jgi:hypothetical protein
MLALINNNFYAAVAGNAVHPHYAVAASFAITQLSSTCVNPLQALRLELTNYFPAEYLESGSDKYITSTNVFST